MSASRGKDRRAAWQTTSRRRLVAFSMAGVAAILGCSDGGDQDLVPSEPEVGEDDREVVPGEGGPVD